MITGKGMFIWQIPRCGQAQQIADLAQVCGFTHVLVKIADGTGVYHGLYNDPADYTTPLINALRANGIEPVGWHYVYGARPGQEAERALERIARYGFAHYVIDAEQDYKHRPGQAREFMHILDSGAPGVAFGLSSYRFPSLHPELPWAEFRARCDFDMPQVYWQSAHNPGAQLRRCVAEYNQFERRLPLIPTGATYREHGWQPTTAEVIEFMQTAEELGLPGFNFWEWYDLFAVMPAEMRDAISGWENPDPPAPSDRVVVAVDRLNIRSAPVVSTDTLIGSTQRGAIWDVTERVADAQGRTWVQSGPTAHLAEWLTTPLYPVPPVDEPIFASPVGTDAERASGEIWPGDWFSALSYGQWHRGSYHTGDDLNNNKPWNADAGAPVHAMGDGVVTFAGPLPGTTWGNVVVIRHDVAPGKAYYSRYAHMARIDVSAGEAVIRGQVIGTIGAMPGDEVGHHLHFDISCTDILYINPGHWPGADKAALTANYVDPRLFLQAFREGR